MSKHRRQRQRARDLAQREEYLRDVIVVAAAIDGHDRAHPALLHERIDSDHPLVTDPIRPHVLTHDESGDRDE